MKTVIKTEKGTFRIEKQPDDPLCMRVSLGGRQPEGFYIVFRGDIKEVKEMMDAAQEAFTKAYEGWLTTGN